MKSQFFLLTSCILLLATFAHAQSIVQVIPLPNTPYYNAGWGLTADASNLYFSSNTSDTTNGRKILKLNFNGQAIDSVIVSRGVNSSQGLARDAAGNLYYLRRYTAVGTIMKFSSTGALLDSMRLPSNKFPGGLAWDGNFVWYSIYSPDNEAGLYKVNFTTKQVVDTILVPTLQPYGMTWDGTYLWYVENGFQSNPQGMFKVNPTTGDTVGFVPAPVDPGGTRPTACAWDGQFMWLLAEPVGANTGRSLYKYNLSGSGTPDIHFSPDSVNLGYCRIGVGVYRSSVQVQNVGTAPLRIDSVGGPILLSTWWGGFSTLPPFSIPPNGSATFSINFEPYVFGAYTWTPPIYSNDPDEPVKIITARGFGISGNAFIVVSSSDYDFGNRRVRSSSPWTLAVQNNGGPQLVISSLNLGTSIFGIDSVTLPITIDSLQSKSFRVWFTPTSATSFVDTLKITSNALNGPITKIVLRGTGDATSIPLGQPFWTYTVPNNPRTSSNSKLMKAVRAISDINGDGKPEVVVSSENYFTMALNGNASVSNDSLWTFNTYIANTSAGSIGSTGDYSHQKALAVADLNRDGFKDVIIGTGGGNEHVYAINGRNGQMLWQFGTDHPDSFSLGDFTGVDVSTDFNADGVPDVLAVAAATESGGVGGRRSAYLFNGTNGQIRWVAPLLGFTHAVAAIPDVNSDGVPDLIGTVGEPSYKFQAFSGANGAELWQIPVPSAQGGGKEVLPWLVAAQPPDAILSAFWGPVYRVNAVNGSIRWQYPTGNRGVLQLARLRDVTGDGVDEVCAALLLGGALCLNGANGNVVWSLPTSNTMGVAVIPDLNRDGFEDVALAVQDQGLMIVKGQNGVQLALYPTGTQQAREVAIIPDIDGNNSFEIIMGGQQGNVALLSGGSGVTSVGGNANGIPEKFKLGQNYPNPFNPTTTIEVQLPHQSDFTLTIFDVLGREVREFRFEKAAAGSHRIVWDGNGNSEKQAASGVYIYVFRTKDLLTAKRMLLLR